MASVSVIAAFCLGAAPLVAGETQAQTVRAPRFEVDPFWPKPLPNHWILGSVVGVAVDSRDHVFIVHRPATVQQNEAGARANPPISECCVPAPPVLEFDPAGNLVSQWGRSEEHTSELQSQSNLVC